MPVDRRLTGRLAFVTKHVAEVEWPHIDEAGLNQMLAETVWDDLDIWRYQKYVERPSLSKIDAKPYMAMRTWATQFYEVPAGYEVPTA